MSETAPRRSARARPADVGLTAALEAAGSTRALADALGITDGAVSQWEEVPVARVLKIEEVFRIPRWKLRPDFYPPPADGSAEAA